MAIAAVSLLFLFATGAILDRGSSASANSESDELIGYFNQYRTSHGVAPLYANPIMNSNSQDQAQENVLTCQFGLTYSSGNHSEPAGMNSVTSWNTYGYNNATDVWAVYSQDSQMQSIVGDPFYNAVGIGMAYNGSCQLGNIWVLDMANFSDVPSVTPTHTPFATSTTPTPTVTPTPSTTPTATATSTENPVPTPSTTSTPRPSQSASPSPPRLQGDANCDSQITALDSLQILLDIGQLAAGTCAGANDVNCDGHVDASDAIIILLFVSGHASSTPECAAVGSPI